MGTLSIILVALVATVTLCLGAAIEKGNKPAIDEVISIYIIHS